jgi:hypothetical protein
MEVIDMAHLTVQLGSGLIRPGPRLHSGHVGWPPRARRIWRRLAFEAVAMVDADTAQVLPHVVPARLWSGILSCESRHDF